MRQLPDHLIFDIARLADVDVPEKGEKRVIRCPFHEDRNASAFLSTRNVFFCSCCTPNGGWSAKSFATALGLDWNQVIRGSLGGYASVPRRVPPAKPKTKGVRFTPSDAIATWEQASSRARDPDRYGVDRDVFDYLAQRGLGECWELGRFGILSPSVTVPAAISHWARRGYRIIVPLFDHEGRIVNVQARAVFPRTPRVLTPTGSLVSGTVFADSRGRSLLRNELASEDRVIFGEGLTDMLALSIASRVPVLTAPGTSVAVDSVSEWARGREVLLALDNDKAGEGAANPVAQACFRQGARRVRRVIWPTGLKDACDVIAARGMSGLEEFLNRLLVEVAA